MHLNSLQKQFVASMLHIGCHLGESGQQRIVCTAPQVNREQGSQLLRLPMDPKRPAWPGQDWLLEVCQAALCQPLQV